MALKNHPITKLIVTCMVPVMWMVVSSGLILLNKHLMVEKGTMLPELNKFVESIACLEMSGPSPVW